MAYSMSKCHTRVMMRHASLTEATLCLNLCLSPRLSSDRWNPLPLAGGLQVSGLPYPWNVINSALHWCHRHGMESRGLADVDDGNLLGRAR